MKIRMITFYVALALFVGQPTLVEASGAQSRAAAQTVSSTVDAAQEDSIKFGSRSLHIPRPQGFEPISAVAPAFVQTLQAYNPNRLAEIYVTPADAKIFSSGQTTDVARYFQLQVARQLDGVEISEEDFREFSKLAETRMRSIVEDNQEVINSQFERGNAKVKRMNSKDPQISVSGPRYLGIYRREPWGVFFTMKMNVAAGGDKEQTPIVLSGALVLANRQVMNLISYAVFLDASDRKWTEQTVSAWADAVHKAN